MSEISGYIEHTNVLIQTMLAVFWLDLVNANGSIPHKLRDLTSERSRILFIIKAILIERFDKIKMSFTSGNFSHHMGELLVGILTGCTVSEVRERNCEVCRETTQRSFAVRNKAATHQNIYG